MSTNPPEQQLPESMTAESRPAETRLSDEFRDLGRNLVGLLHAFRENPLAKEVEGQLTQAVHEVEHQIDEAMANARKGMQEQNLRDTIRGAAQTAVDETQRGLTRGLHLLNDQLSRTIQEVNKTRPTGPKGQVIEIESDTAGETPAATTPQASDTPDIKPPESL